VTREVCCWGGRFFGRSNEAMANVALKQGRYLFYGPCTCPPLPPLLCLCVPKLCDRSAAQEQRQTLTVHQRCLQACLEGVGAASLCVCLDHASLAFPLSLSPAHDVQYTRLPDQRPQYHCVPILALCVDEDTYRRLILHRDPPSTLVICIPTHVLCVTITLYTQASPSLHAFAYWDGTPGPP